MKRLTVLVKKHNKILYLDPSIIVKTGSTLILKNATVFWEYDNVILNENDEMILKKTNPTKTEKITFEPGYWNFTMIKEKLSSNAVKLEATRFNNKCTIKSSDGVLDLGSFGLLLGFKKGTVVQKGVWNASPDVVNVNQNFKFINISCNIVNSFENHNTIGNKSFILASLPVTSKQTLNGSSTFYKGINSETVISDGVYNRIEFNVEANNGLKGACVEVLLELFIREPQNTVVFL